MSDDAKKRVVLTPEQRAQIGRIKTAARALVDEMVDELLEDPGILEFLERRWEPDGVRLMITSMGTGIITWSRRLDTPE